MVVKFNRTRARAASRDKRIGFGCRDRQVARERAPDRRRGRIRLLNLDAIDPHTGAICLLELQGNQRCTQQKKAE